MLIAQVELNRLKEEIGRIGGGINTAYGSLNGKAAIMVARINSEEARKSELALQVRDLKVSVNTANLYLDMVRLLIESMQDDLVQISNRLDEERKKTKIRKHSDESVLREKYNK